MSKTEAPKPPAPVIDWQPMETAPRDGSRFLAYCGETGSEGIDTAQWSGKTPTDRIGHFRTRYGWIPMAWAPMPNRPENIPSPRQPRTYY